MKDERESLIMSGTGGGAAFVQWKCDRRRGVREFLTAGISLELFFDLDFIFFFAPALLYFVFQIPRRIDFLMRGGAMQLTARRTASLRPSGGGYRFNRAETFGGAAGVNCDEFGRGAWGSGKAVLVGALGCKHLVDSFCIGRETKVSSR